MKALGGLCPACVLRRELQEPRDDARARALRKPAPTIAELAPHFPDLELVAPIGQGGMGAVYRVVQKGLGRVAALKVLALDADLEPEFAERFEREARLLAGLRHGNIVGVHAAGKSGPHWYLLMEFVEGPSLRQLIEDGEVEPRLALSIVSQVCDALQHAHERGVVHRDVKPENILVGRDGVAKILDFGLAKMVAREPRAHTLTLSGQVMGTLRYMAPEQYERPLEVDHRADIYSLGIVLYELLTGEVPMGAFAPASRKANIDARVDEIVRRSLEREPARRYQHASDVRVDMAQVQLGAAPGVAGPAPAPALAPELAPAPAPATRAPRRLELMRLLAHILWIGAGAALLLWTMLAPREDATVLATLLLVPPAVVALACGAFLLHQQRKDAPRPLARSLAAFSTASACLALAGAIAFVLGAPGAWRGPTIALLVALVATVGAALFAWRLEPPNRRLALGRGAALGTIALGMVMLADALAEGAWGRAAPTPLFELILQGLAALALIVAGCGLWLVVHWPSAEAAARPHAPLGSARALGVAFAGGVAALGALAIGGVAAAASIGVLAASASSVALVAAGIALGFGQHFARVAARPARGEATPGVRGVAAGAVALALVGAVATFAGEGVGSWSEFRARRASGLELPLQDITRPRALEVVAWDVDPNDPTPRAGIEATNQGSVDTQRFLERSSALPRVQRNAFAPGETGDADREFHDAWGLFVWFNYYAQLLTHAQVEWRDATSAKIRVPRLHSLPRLRDTAQRMLDLRAVGALELDSVDIDQGDYRQTLSGPGVHASNDLAKRNYAWSVNQHQLDAAVADRASGGQAAPRRSPATVDDALDAVDLRKRMELGSIDARIELHQLDGRPRGRILWADGRVTEIDEDAMTRHWSHLPGLLWPDRR